MPLNLPKLDHIQTSAGLFLRSYIKPKEWWESVEWDHPDAKILLEPFFRILKNLEENCLLEKAERDSYNSYFIYKKTMHMHDVVRDMALHITRKIFMVKARMQSKEVPKEEEWSEDLEKYFPNLNILDLSHNPFESLPESISSLEKLKVLLLTSCYRLKSITPVLKLQALKKLDLEGSGVKEIPHDLEMPVNLRYLNLKDDMRELNKLEVFEAIKSKALQRCKKFGGYWIEGCNCCEVDCCDMLEAVFSSKCHQLQTLESLILIRLQNLNVIVGAGVEESSVGTFSSLKVITLVKCEKIKKMFSTDWVLPNLENLIVSTCSKLEEIIAEPQKEGTGAFKISLPKLKRLTLCSLPELKSICSENGVIVCDSLECIEIVCEKVKWIPLYLPQLQIDDEGKPTPSNPLKEIRVHSTYWWESVEWDHPNFDVKKVVKPLVLNWLDRSLDWRPL
ncbi:putative disease resistance protein [Gossypium australe]|uniref:Putative disease resistance protein n=1 Tax=Gossypium australe TaxID=47621 RepID=A0A5B6VTZ3_9ROSI|nr:putative disease resistance protein [Gossypium australe]